MTIPTQPESKLPPTIPVKAASRVPPTIPTQSVEQLARKIASLHRPSLKRSLLRFVKNVRSFFVAITSPLWKKRLTNAQYEARIAACLGCEHLQRTNAAPFGFCGACGCGKNKFSELTVKANLPGASCPKGKWHGDPVQPAHGAK